MRIRVTIDMDIQEELVREHYVGSAAVEHLHLLSGGDLRDRGEERDGLDRLFYVNRLAWDNIMGSQSHGADLGSKETRVEILDAPTILPGEGICTGRECGHYLGEHDEQGCRGWRSINGGVDPEGVQHWSGEPCTCTRKGSSKGERIVETRRVGDLLSNGEREIFERGICPDCREPSLVTKDGPLGRSLLRDRGEADVAVVCKSLGCRSHFILGRWEIKRSSNRRWRTT